jgi:hypothetical protein
MYDLLKGKTLVEERAAARLLGIGSDEIRRRHKAELAA